MDNKTKMALKLALIALDKLLDKKPSMFLMNGETGEQVTVGQAYEIIEDITKCKIKI